MASVYVNPREDSERYGRTYGGGDLGVYGKASELTSSSHLPFSIMRLLTSLLSFTL